MPASSIGCTVLGLGRMGYRHAELLAAQLPGARLIAVFDPVAERTREVAERFGVKGYAAWQDALNDSDTDAVFIVTPSETHTTYCLEALAAGKAVFCEKPLALTLADCDAIIAKVNQTGLPFQLGFMRRFDPGYAGAKRAIEEGMIGEVTAYTGISRDPAAPPPAYVAQSGGIYMDALIHEFDAARFLMGDEVRRLYACGKVLVHPWMRELGDVDHAHVFLDFARGGLGHIEGSRNAGYGYDIRAEVMGTKGAITIGYGRQTPITIQTAAGIQHDFVPGFLERFADAYRLEMEAFIRCLQTGRTPAVTAWDGRQALLLAQAAKQSQASGRPVDLDEFAQHQEV